MQFRVVQKRIRPALGSDVARLRHPCGRADQGAVLGVTQQTIYGVTVRSRPGCRYQGRADAVLTGRDCKRTHSLATCADSQALPPASISV
jgi:hypothetical protein